MKKKLFYMCQIFISRRSHVGLLCCQLVVKLAAENIQDI